MGPRSVTPGTPGELSAIFGRLVSRPPSSPPDAASNVPHTRRGGGGARREASERVTIRRDAFETLGWTLNLSRGGVRVIVEDPVEVDEEYDVNLADAAARKARVVWARNEADGQIVGLQFLDVEGTVPPPPGDPE